VVKNLKELRYSACKRTRHSQLVRIRLPYARVLVVDDNVTNLDVAKGMLQAYGMKIDCVTGGQQAIDAVRGGKVKYNAIFMDHMMPGMDGMEATRCIREEIGTEYAKTVPIIALTANAIVGNKEVFLSRGFQAFLSKPIELSQLDAVVRQWVRDKNREDASGYENDEEMFFERRVWKDRRGVNERRAAGPQTPLGLEKISGLNTDKGLMRFGGDEKTYLHVLRSYVMNTRLILETVKHVNEENLDDYIFAVHGIKASSRGIGADEVGDRADALEKMSMAGDMGFVRANHAAFYKAAEELMFAIEEVIGKIAAEKPKKNIPDHGLLSRIREACENYDIDGLDSAMSELETCEYESDDGLAAWLRENVDRMNYEEIIRRLSAL
jgi:CheY-like chemotaxis protein